MDFSDAQLVQCMQSFACNGVGNCELSSLLVETVENIGRRSGLIGMYGILLFEGLEILDLFDAQVIDGVVIYEVQSGMPSSSLEEVRKLTLLCPLAR